MKNLGKKYQVQLKRLTNITLITSKEILTPIKWRKKIAKFL